ncbi:MAG: undecaprenyl-diphosphate phosphatase [Myxococcales bacterium]|nr:undecaprenyl-diphosphate phosphatase [Myxococcales bacterium]
MPILLIAAILGLVEGLTEFLPVSSTGHLIVVSSWLGFESERANLFNIVIQSAAILAVCWEYRERLRDSMRGVFREPKATRFVLNIGIAFVPLALVGFLFGKKIKALLFNPGTVAASFVVGGVVILVMERWLKRRPGGEERPDTLMTVDDVSPLKALQLGLLQTLALIPGVSRSGATIIGGLGLGLSRKAAAEFSFFLAVPTLGMATLYELYKERHLIVADDWAMWLVGFTTAFLSAFACIRWMLRYVTTHGFGIFAWYRIAVGFAILFSLQ